MKAELDVVLVVMHEEVGREPHLVRYARPTDALAFLREWLERKSELTYHELNPVFQKEGPKTPLCKALEALEIYAAAEAQKR